MAQKGPSTSCKDAIKQWREKNDNQDPSKARVVKLLAQIPSIQKMDNQLNMLHECEHLSLSTNAIDKIGQLTLKNLRILSLGRNNIKRIEKLDDVAPTLEELWLSYNQIEKLDTVPKMNLKKLRVLYLSNNNIKDWGQLENLKSCDSLEELLLLNNPIYTDLPREQILRNVLTHLPKLKKLDGEIITEVEKKRIMNPMEQKDQ